MDIKKIETELGITNLKSHLINEITISKMDADIQTDKVINDILERVKTTSINKNSKSLSIIGELIHLKKILYIKEISNIHFYINSKSFFPSLELNFNNNEEVEINKLVDYIIEVFTFLNQSHIFLIGQIKNLKSEFSYFFTSSFLEKKSSLLFDELNNLNCLPDFNWNLNSIDNGIIEFQRLLILEKEFNEEKSNLKVESLNDKVETLNREIEYKNGTIEYYNEYHKKYLEHQPTFIVETYFGDNQPFILNLYIFLTKKSVLRMTGWSYFYSCMATTSSEIINLSNYNNLKFIGKVFYCLQDFISPKYKSDYMEFIISKFYINENPINKNFFKNHMRPVYDETLHPDFEDIDDFFDRQRKIFLK